MRIVVPALGLLLCLASHAFAHTGLTLAEAKVLLHTARPATEGAVMQQLVNLAGEMPLPQAIAVADSLVMESQPIDKTGLGLQMAIGLLAVQYDRANHGTDLLIYLQKLANNKAFAKPYQQRIIARFMGTKYHTLADFDRSRWWLERYLKYPVNDAGSNAHLNALTTLALVYEKQRLYAKARPLLEQAMKLSLVHDNKAWFALSNGNLGALLFRMGNGAEALPYLRTDLREAMVQKQFMSAAGNYNLLAGWHLQQGQKMTAKIMADSALLLIEMSEERKDQLGVPEAVYRTAAKVAEANDNPAQSLRYLQMAYAVNDSLLARRLLSTTKSKLAEINEQERFQSALDLRNMQAAKKQNELIFMIVTIGCLVVLGLALWALRQNRQIHKMLMEKQLRSEQEKQAAERRQAQLAALNVTKNKLFSIVAHDLRGPINTMHSLLLSVDDDLAPAIFVQEALPLIRHQVGELGSMMDNLLQWAHAQQEGIRTQPHAFLVGALVKKIAAVLRSQAEEKNIHLQVAIGPGEEAFADPHQMEVVVRNLMSNAIKFSQSGGEVLVTAFAQDGRCRISVADNGVGMTPDKMASLFATSQVASTFGTNGEKGVGLGLLICKEFIRNNQGQIHVHGRKPRGSEFVVDLPIPLPPQAGQMTDRSEVFDRYPN